LLPAHAVMLRKPGRYATEKRYLTETLLPPRC
jgi:hypothetical protein